MDLRVEFNAEVIENKARVYRWSLLFLAKGLPPPKTSNFCVFRVSYVHAFFAKSGSLLIILGFTGGSLLIKLGLPFLALTGVTIVKLRVWGTTFL